jgi:hypothetical protein
MALEKATITTPGSWFLLARTSNLLLRLRDELLIGEDHAGELMLTPGEGQASVAITTLGNRIVLRSLDSDWVLVDQDLAEPDHDADQQTGDGIECDEGETVRLSLPHNTFTLTGDPIRHGAVSRNVELIARPALQPIKAPRRESVDETASIADTITDTIVVKEVPPEPPAALVDDVEIPTLEILAESPPPAAPATRPVESELSTPAQPCESPLSPAITFVLEETGSASPPDTGDNRHLPGKIALAGVIVGLLVLVFLARTPVTVSPTVSTASVPRSATNLELLGSSSQRLPISPSQPVADTTSHTDLRDATILPPQNIEPAQPPPDISPQLSIAAPAAPSRAYAIDVPPAWLETRLEEAEMLLSAGTIYDVGERNAVQALTEILRADPDNEQAMQLMYQCASQLVADAAAARDAGEDYQARNLVEEVLAFHPSHPGALELKSQLF